MRKRIELYYGTGYGVIIHSTPGEGTEVGIRLPLAHESAVQDIGTPSDRTLAFDSL